MKGTPTTTIHFKDTENTSRTENTDTEAMDNFNKNVTKGDYITIVYKNPDTGGLVRSGGTIERVRRLNHRFDELLYRVEDSQRTTTGIFGYLHLNTNTGDYYFVEDITSSSKNFGVEKVAWTPPQNPILPESHRKPD